MIRILCLILISLFITGCSRDTVSVPTDGIETQATDPQSGAEIRVHIADDDIEIADQLTVTVVIEWPDSVSLWPIEPNWDATGWTLIHRSQQPTSTTQSGFLTSISYLIEPFLPGSYAVPSFSVSILPDSEPADIASSTYELESIPLSVQVQSVLETQEFGDLEPANGYLDPRAVLSENHEASSLLFVIALLFIVAVVMIYWVKRSITSKSESEESVFFLLEKIAEDSSGSKADSYNTLYQIFDRLDLQLQQTSEIRSLIERCEHARFSMHPVNDLDPRTIARHTLELLGKSDRDSA